MTPPEKNKGLVFNETKGRLTFNEDVSEAQIVRQQEISSEYFDQLAAIKEANDNAPAGEFMCVASIPEIVVDQWRAEGFDIFDPNIGLDAILARLRLEDKGKLILTDRNL